MENREKYDEAFIKIFLTSKKELGENLEYNSITAWDSVGHMGLMAELEETFEIVMDIDDIIDFSSYNKGFEIVAKYGVQF
jgi:acyl carrier protein